MNNITFLKQFDFEIELTKKFCYNRKCYYIFVIRANCFLKLWENHNYKEWKNGNFTI